MFWTAELLAHRYRHDNLRTANGGGWPHHNAHLQAGMPNEWRVEYHYLMWQVGETIYEDPFDIDAGEVELPEVFGLELEPDRDALEETRVK